MTGHMACQGIQLWMAPAIPLSSAHSVPSSSQRCLDQHEDALSNSPGRQWPEGIVRLGSLLRVKDGQAWSRWKKANQCRTQQHTTTHFFHPLHLVSPSAFMTLSFIVSRCYILVFSRDVERSRAASQSNRSTEVWTGNRQVFNRSTLVVVPTIANTWGNIQKYPPENYHV